MGKGDEKQLVGTAYIHTHPYVENGIPTSGTPRAPTLLAEIELVNDLSIPLNLVLLKVVQESAAFPNEV